MQQVYFKNKNMTEQELAKLKFEKENLEKKLNAINQSISDAVVETEDDMMKRLQFEGILKFNYLIDMLPIDENIEVDETCQAFRVGSSISREQLNSISEFGINPYEQLTSVISNEFAQSAAKCITKKLAEQPPFIIDTVDDYKNILKYCSTRKYIITNAAIGSALQDTLEYVSVEIKTINNASGLMYNVGKLKDAEIYVDPYMRWDDTRIYVFDEPFANFYLKPLDKIITVSENTFAPRIEAYIMYGKINDVKSETFVISNDIASKLI